MAKSTVLQTLLKFARVRVLSGETERGRGAGLRPALAQSERGERALRWSPPRKVRSDKFFDAPDRAGRPKLRAGAPQLAAGAAHATSPSTLRTAPTSHDSLAD